MRVINIIDRLDDVNFGVWNAAVFTAGVLRDQFGVQSEVWAPPHSGWNADAHGLDRARFITNVSRKELQIAIRESKIDPADTVIATHGTWSFATRWGKWLADEGFSWVYAPQGMLEPWSLSQKWIRKRVYGSLIEFPAANKARIIRAVSTPEKNNLLKLFPQHDNVQLIPNGVDIPYEDLSQKDHEKKTILFLSRLHHKKGVVPLVNAFLSSQLANSRKFELIVGGPDQGELPKIQQLLKAYPCENLHLLGPVFGDDKRELLRRCSYFALPTFSEGFPTAVVEAMSLGCIPIISEGCNFPEARHLSMHVTTEVESIRQALDSLAANDSSHLATKQQESMDFIQSHYSIEKIAESQFQSFKACLDRFDKHEPIS